VFKCGDGDVVLAVGNDSQFAKMCVALRRPELARDPRYAKNADRVRNMNELMALIAEIFLLWSRADLVRALESAGVPCGPINSIADVFAQEQIKHRGMRMDLQHPKSGSVPQVANPINFAATPLAYGRAPPLLGQHSDEILHELGISNTEIAKLRGDGVV
jgi:crotonobetainyl-CoA:carnitine CoA-transferase CaiB-like acyl-CoA transferase